MSSQFFENFLSKLAAHISGTVRRRCFTRRELISILIQIRDELAVSGQKQTSGTRLLDRLVDAGVARLVPVRAAASPKSKAFDIYLFGLGASVESLHPVELLQASRPEGVVCDFTALWLHSLTTQVPTHHHVALMYSSPDSERPNPRRESSTRPKNTRRRDPLGTVLFSFEDIRYYQTLRLDRRMPGVQSRYLTDTTIFRITTREQALLDALHYPRPCGGPPVVFEAWDTGLELIDEQLIVEHLDAIDDARLDLKVGYMLEQRGHNPKERLGARIDAARELLAQREPSVLVPLLRGYHFTNTDHRWRLEIP